MEQLKQRTQDPGERLEMALQEILKKDPTNVTAKKLAAARAARGFRGAGASGEF